MLLQNSAIIIRNYEQEKLELQRKYKDAFMMHVKSELACLKELFPNLDRFYISYTAYDLVNEIFYDEYEDDYIRSVKEFEYYITSNDIKNKLFPVLYSTTDIMQVPEKFRSTNENLSEQDCKKLYLILDCSTLEEMLATIMKDEYRDSWLAMIDFSEYNPKSTESDWDDVKITIVDFEE